MKNFLKNILFVSMMSLGFISLTSCQNAQMAAQEAVSVSGEEVKQDEAIAAAQVAADAAAMKANEAFQAAQTARRVAERAVEMANQNQAALRALNDKIDRMFETISRK